MDALSDDAKFKIFLSKNGIKSMEQVWKIFPAFKEKIGKMSKTQKKESTARIVLIYIVFQRNQEMMELRGHSKHTPQVSQHLCR
jgi:hypothetical protein